MNTIFQKQQKSLVNATFKKGIFSAIHTATNSADVIIVGSVQTVVKNVPLSSSLISIISTLKQGQRCKVDCFNEANPRDWVVSYTY
jgi:excinuclease UvrABC helicase subunit UvrB